MIRIRDGMGKASLLPPDTLSVELCSTDGKIARLLLCSNDRVEILGPEDLDFRKYCKALKLEMAEVIALEEH